MLPAIVPHSDTSTSAHNLGLETSLNAPAGAVFSRTSPIEKSTSVATDEPSIACFFLW